MHCHRETMQDGSTTAGWAVAMAALLASLGVSAAVALWPDPATQPVAALFPPWWARARAAVAVTAAGGRILREGGWLPLLIGQSADPGFIDNLHRRGAWLVVRAQPGSGCTSAEAAR